MHTPGSLDQNAISENNNIVAPTVLKGKNNIVKT